MPQIHRHSDPVLVVVCALGFWEVLYLDGQLQRARQVAQSALDPRAGPVAYSAALWHAAAVETLTGGDTDRARATVIQALQLVPDEGLTGLVFDCVFVAAAIAAQRHDTEAAAVLLAGAARHADPLGFGGGWAAQACRLEAKAAVDTYPGDLTAAQRQGEAMTLDDLTTYTIDTLT